MRIGMPQSNGLMGDTGNEVASVKVMQRRKSEGMKI